MSGLSQGLGAGGDAHDRDGADAWTAMRQRLAQRGELPPLGSSIARARRGSRSARSLGDKVQYIGKIGAFDIWTYQDTYLDDTGAAADDAARHVIGVSATRSRARAATA
jgi:hypothetical protein